MQSDNGYPRFENGSINWRLYWEPRRFAAERTKEGAYEKSIQSEYGVSLPPLDEIPEQLDEIEQVEQIETS